jgi:hypothetical protein
VSDLPYDIAMAGPDVQAHYKKMVAAGQSPRFAEMCALQAPPGTKGTDRAFMEGRYDGNWLDALPKRQASWLTREARAAGISISGKYYMGGLADKRGHLDPEAWVGGVDDIKRVAAKRNLTVKGIVNVEGHDVAPKRVDLNPKIARELARKEMAKNPKLSMREAIEKVKDKAVPRWKKRGK